MFWEERSRPPHLTTKYISPLHEHLIPWSIFYTHTLCSFYIQFELHLSLPCWGEKLRSSTRFELRSSCPRPCNWFNSIKLDNCWAGQNCSTCLLRYDEQLTRTFDPGLKRVQSNLVMNNRKENRSSVSQNQFESWKTSIQLKNTMYKRE